MESWHVVAPRDLRKFDAPEEETPIEGEARVKIFDVLVAPFDHAVFSGNTASAFPVLPGRYAVGKISELYDGYNGYLEKGNRVFIDPHFLDKNFNGDSTPLQGMDSIKIAGVNRPGFLAPYASVSTDNLYVLPESVSNENALYIYLIALAESALDKIGEIKGKYIAVIGACALGIILCQLLSYYQAVPILIDNRTARLDFAKSCGVNYAFLNDDNLDSHINSITGAAFADGAIYVGTGSTVVSTVVFRVVAPDKNVVFCRTYPGMLQTDLETALKKQLHVMGVSRATENISTAINLLANHAVDVSKFSHGIYSLSRLPEVYRIFEKEYEKESPSEPMAIVDCYGKL
ncbi:MAG: zinc-binding dehydrogenase [Clostridia bacterium]|nr:zinc-binding dehydrogenase [Clostridia bacterium]